MTVDKRPLIDRFAGCHVWASDLHRSLEQLREELQDLGQQATADRLALAQGQLALVCRELEGAVAGVADHC